MGNNRAKKKMRKIIIVLIVVAFSNAIYAQDCFKYHCKGISDELIEALNAENPDYPINKMEGERDFLICNSGVAWAFGYTIAGRINFETLNGVFVTTVTTPEIIISVSDENVLKVVFLSDNVQCLYDVLKIEGVDNVGNNSTNTYNQTIQQDYSGLVQQYQYWDKQAQLYYQYLGQETNYSLRMTYLSNYKQAQAQMGQIRASSYGKIHIQQSPFETYPAPSNPNK